MGQYDPPLPNSVVKEDDYDAKAFYRMYGKDAEFVVPTNMMQVAKTMNKKFLEK